MAEKYNLYLIFDMHGCPGGQNGDHACGKSGRNYLYSQEKYQIIMEDLWIKLATRYKSCAQVVAYDIMNEPMNNCDYFHGVKLPYRYTAGSSEAVAATNIIYNRMIKAIRKYDKCHVITVEGIWTSSCLPDPETMGWTNMMYQLHTYNSLESEIANHINQLTKVSNTYNVAAYIGEFNPQAYYDKSIKIFDQNNVSWTCWNYKTFGIFGTPQTWGMYYRDLNNTQLKELKNEAGLSSTDYYNLASSQTLSVLSDDKILALYRALWTRKYLSTESFTTNNTYISYIK